LTQNQLHELLDSDQAKALVEGAEERGYLEPAELEAFSLEHDLNENEIEELTRELESIGLEVRQPAAEAEKEAEKEKAPEPAKRTSSRAPLTAFSFSSQTSDATSCSLRRRRSLSPRRSSAATRSPSGA